MTNWVALQDAYGSARDVPNLLAAAEAGTGDDRGVWDELWGRLCHQGTVYGASYAALPALTSMAGRHSPAGYVEPLHLAAAIIGADDGAEAFTEIRHRYSAELSALRDMAEQNLALADGPVEFVYALQALLALEGIPTWRYRLEALADEELGVACPQCLEYLYLDLAGPDFRTTVADDGTATPTPIIPARPDDLSDGAVRMHDLAARHRHTDVAAGILYLVGDATCPACGTRFGVPRALAEERTRN
jgi:hypothetical protein